MRVSEISTTRVVEKARAKINLTLHVTGRREDGYHLLDSLVVFADYGDDLILSPASTTSLEIKGPFGKGLEAEDNNLILQAHRFLSQKLKRPVPPTHFELVKNLPVSSGIGGGSSDAAAALRGLIKLWQLDVDEQTLGEIALTLGADVPVCLNGTTCQMQGIGEVISPVSHFTPLYIVLVNAGVKVSTPLIFSQLNLQKGSPAFDALEPFENVQSQDQWITWLENGRNDMQQAAMSQSEKIAQTLDAIDHTSNLLFSRMSGSGATCFGLYTNKQDAQTACDKIKRDHGDWWAVASRIV